MNIRSINSNFDKLATLLSYLKLTWDVIILTECWLSKALNVPTLDGYLSYVSKEILNQNDGVVIYIRNDIDHKIEYPDFKDGNTIICKLGNSSAIVAIYRSPSHKKIVNFLNSLQMTLTDLAPIPSVSVIGDINIDIIPENKPKLNPDDYLNLISSLGYSPTHYFPTHDKSCLDHVLLKSKHNSKTIILNDSITDHAPTLLSLDLEIQRLKPKSVRFHTNFPSVKADIDSCDFSDIITLTEPNTATELLVTKLSNIITSHTTVRNLPRRQRTIKPWITPGLLKCIRNRDRLYKKYKKSPEKQANKITYTRYRNFCNSLLKKLKHSYEKNEFEKAKNKPKATWEVIKKITNTYSKSSTPIELLQLSSDPMASLNKVNHFFSSVGASLANNIQNTSKEGYNLPSQSSPLESQLNSLTILDVDVNEINKIILGLRNDSAVGWDGISASVIKSSRLALAPIITHVCQLCLSAGVFPNTLKKALVHPIHKGGEKDNMTNYRPISVLTTMSKILEKVLNDRLVGFLTKYNIIAQNQYGFCKGKSTEDAVLHLTEKISKTLDKKSKCIGIFLDLKKAFDTVSMPLLINKLSRVGIRGLALDIFKDYLTQRSQRVKIDHYLSRDASLTYGVPQGSILGPTLFLLYINDLCKLSIPNCNIVTYADDTALLVDGITWDTARIHAERSLEVVMKWLSGNLLTLNLDKTMYLTFALTSPGKPPHGSFAIRAHNKCIFSYYNQSNCSCETLKRVDRVKYLGVIIDDSLSWGPHITSLTCRARKLIYIFKLLRPSADMNVLYTVYNALAQSILSYCITAWGGAPKTSIIKLERAQRAILKVINGKPFRYPTMLLYCESKVLTVRQLFIHQSILRTHTSHPYDPFLTVKRRKDRVFQSFRCNTGHAQRQFYIIGPRLYNNISKDLELYHLTKNACKPLIKKWLLKFSYEDTEKLLDTLK